MSDDTLAQRYRAQLEAMDLTPLPTSDSWTVETLWKPIDEHDPARTAIGFPERERAKREALNMCCCGGALRVRLADPSGTIRNSWARSGNFWMDHDEAAGSL